MPPVRSRNGLRAVTSRIRVDDDVSVARNVDFPLTQVKCVPVEAGRAPRDSHRAPYTRAARHA
ncbi:hypothetical protein DIE17_03085 [Burkholderia sp. Bp9099]|nr:hypothetical protein DIE17_03085 [Burkholderia sp. Bp9099]